LLKKKQAGQLIERPREPARSNVVNLMDALRQSIESEGGQRAEKPAARTSHRKPAKAPAKHKKAS
jgi:non-homologous end joining protein Ku